MKLRSAHRCGRSGPAALVAGLAAAALASPGAVVAGARSATTPSPSRPPDQRDWLGEINRYRRAAGIPPVHVDAQWEVGLQHHLAYLRRTPRKLISGPYASLHTENPLSPYYTPDGAKEAVSSDLALGGAATPVQAIQRWLAAPFHAIGMLRPRLSAVALALSGAYAGLDVIHGVDWTQPRPSRPVLFPGQGVTTNLSAFGGEYPDPLETCGWRGPAGLPLVVLLPGAPQETLSATLARRGGRTSTSGHDLCIVDERTYHSSDLVYGPTGAQILSGDHAVLLIPRARLANGNYSATVTQPGSRDIRWSFSVNTRAGAASP